MTNRPMYGQVVVGPPGSGKTTFCDGMQQYLRLLGRNAWVINLDPANETTSRPQKPQDETETITRDIMNERKDEGMARNEDGDDEAMHHLPYETLYDVCHEVVNLSTVMRETSLGPNGGLVYCMEYLEAHSDEIIEQIRDRVQSHAETASPERVYLIFDLPGQVELYTHSTCVQVLLYKLVRTLDLRLAAVQLVDAHYCTDASKFLSAALLSTTTMLRLELPTVNVLSKVDLLAKYGELPMQLEYFTQCHDLDRILPFLDDPMTASLQSHGQDPDFDIAENPTYQRARQKRRQSQLYRKFEKLHAALAEVVEDYGLLTFVPLDITSAKAVGRVLARIDKCNGYVFTGRSVNEDLFQCAIQSDDTYEALAEVNERILASETMNELNGLQEK